MKTYLILFPVLALITGFYILTRKKTMSRNGIELLKKFESFSALPYKDQAGLWTIGWGHLINQGETFTEITRYEGELILKGDLAIAENSVNGLVKVKLSQNMFDALVSFVFNVGTGNFSESTLLRVLNEGNYIEAQNQLARWNKTTVNGSKIISQGLINRRQHEQNLFFT